ncbi:hypothetical protein [Variovorax guangxiensis]|uniref:hypothetical protein n=1 Tax=Variovorax guangxiensis TaxID=1775474 RepID=UPI002855AA0A|nr:hypothetical protein [Variovorax guangxiensis]MDR6860987.1 hypothetical protein [Variovorax guangxiensis]
MTVTNGGATLLRSALRLVIRLRRFGLLARNPPEGARVAPSPEQSGEEEVQGRAGQAWSIVLRRRFTATSVNAAFRSSEFLADVDVDQLPSEAG